MRVLQVLPGIVRGGGAEQSLAMIAPHLIADGIDVHLAYLDRTSDVQPELERLGVVVHDSTGRGGVIGTARRVRSLAQTISPNVIHSTLFDADIPVRLASLGLPSALLTTWANTTYDQLRSRLEPGRGTWKQEAVRLIDLASTHISRTAVHAVTEGVAADGCRALHVRRDRVTVVERGRDLSRFHPADPERRRAARDEFGAGDDEFVILCVARQSHQKGHVHLLDAFARLVGRGDNVRLVLVGPPGPATGAIYERLRTLPEVGRIADRLVDLGERSDVADILPGADVFVLPSLAEGAAGAILEAMACEIPVVSTALPGYEGWLIDGRHALFATPGDADALAACLHNVIDDPAEARERARTGRALVEQRFSVERSAAAMAALYRSLAKAGS